MMNIEIQITRGGNLYMKIDSLSLKNQHPDNLEIIVDKLRRDYKWVDGFIVKVIKVKTSMIEVYAK